MGMVIMQVDPYSIEVRYTLGLMAYHLKTSQPGSVRIASSSIEMVKATVRYLIYEPVRILVENAEIQSHLAESLGVVVEVVEHNAPPADAALFPFSLEEGMRPGNEQTIIVACRNALSYKSFVHPGAAQGTIFQKLARLKRSYRLKTVAGLYSPRFIILLALAKAVEHWDSSRYFFLENRAMSRLIETGPLWRFSYIVVVTGKNAC